jgi:DNA polymerase III delta prime subunit
VLQNPNWESDRNTPTLTPEFFLNLYAKMMENGTDQEFCLLEYSFETLESFIRDLFQLSPSEEIPTTYSETLRPDILIIGNRKVDATRFSKVKFQEKAPIRELLPDGTIREVLDEELTSRVGISIIDVKLSRPDSIGKKYFFEILFYFIALNRFLHIHGLDDKFFIRIDENGIFPRYANIKELKLTFPEIRRKIVKMPFKDTYILYETLSNKLHEFTEKIPCQIEDIPLNLQSICARCKYLEDCKKTLKCDDCYPREQWDLQLIPYTSKTISEQLKDSSTPSYETIKDVADRIDTHPQEVVPTPLYAEKPFLKHRAQALLEDEPVRPETGKHFTISIPKYSPISLIMNFETDPIHEVVCAVSFHLSCFIPDYMNHYEKFVKWWNLWKSFIRGAAALDSIRDIILTEFPVEDGEDIDEATIIRTLKRFASALKVLFLTRDNKDYPWLALENISRKETYYSTLKLNYSVVNKGLTHADENAFSELVVSLLYALVMCIQNMEWFITEEGKSLNSAIFYWSQEQIDYLEEFLERNLGYLNDSPALRTKTLYLFRWFNPSESRVKHPYHHKKFFNLRAFAETSMSFPLIINYTWHELAAYLSKIDEFRPIFGNREQTFYEIYWNPHFNFIDFQQWYRYLYKDGAEKLTLLNELKRQVIKKARTLDKLRQAFQQHGRESLLGYNKPKSMAEFLDYDLPEEYHNIAHIWYLFENYTTAYDEFELDRIRSMYPNYGIGKLESAKVNRIKQVPTDTGGGRYTAFSYEFELQGMSSNVKLDENDWVICVPALLRNTPRYKNYKWRIVIDDMNWEGDHWKVRTQPWSIDLLENYIDELEGNLPYVKAPSLQSKISKRIVDLRTKRKKLRELENPVLINDTFYLYSQVSNPWAKKLEELLEIGNFGDSWLGKALAFKWNLTQKTSLRYPEPFPYEGWLTEVYLYAPLLLPSFLEAPDKLLTPISPPPDPSQEKAIMNTMKYTVYGIQGPPGTGKTQTIVALIDEFLHRHKKQNKSPVKVLVMAFSYAALRVGFRNISKSRNATGNLTEAAKASLVFLRSQHRNPPSAPSSRPFYDVFTRGKKTLVIKRKENDMSDGDETLAEITHENEEKFQDILKTDENNIIIFGNAHHLCNLNEKRYGIPRFIRFGFEFDLIVVDESSQVPVNHIIAALQYVNNEGIKVRSHEASASAGGKISNLDELNELYMVSGNGEQESEVKLEPANLTKLVIVGDQNQLPPVQQVLPPKKLEPILDNLFGFYADYHSIANDQLQFNYRSHQDIVDFTNYLDIYEHTIEPLTNKDKMIEGDLKRLRDWIADGREPKIEEWVVDVLNKGIAVESLIHHNKFETAVSPLEAHIVIQLVLGYYVMNMPPKSKLSDTELKRLQRNFWGDKLGVVAPHNAQGRLIIRQLHQLLNDHGLNTLEERELMELLKKAIVSVEKFQGSARDFIITSIGISAQDQLLNEEEFIYNLNRFNVLSSRARAKFIFICSENFLTYIPNDKELMQTAAKIRQFALDYCSNERALELEWNGKKAQVRFRYRS